jgi:hypothetical protein
VARVFVTRTLPGGALDRLGAAGHELDVWPDRLPPPAEALREQVAGADALLCMLTDRVDAELLDAAPRLRAIANYAVGSDNITFASERPSLYRSMSVFQRTLLMPTMLPTIGTSTLTLFGSSAAYEADAARSSRSDVSARAMSFVRRSQMVARFK